MWEVVDTWGEVDTCRGQSTLAGASRHLRGVVDTWGVVNTCRGVVDTCWEVVDTCERDSMPTYAFNFLKVHFNNLHGLPVVIVLPLVCFSP